MEVIVRLVTKNLMRSRRYLVSSKLQLREIFGYTESIHSKTWCQQSGASSAYALTLSHRVSAFPRWMALSRTLWGFGVESAKVLASYSCRGQCVRTVTGRIGVGQAAADCRTTGRVSCAGPESLGSAPKNKVLKSSPARPEIQATGLTGPSGSQCRHWQTLATDAGSTGLQQE